MTEAKAKRNKRHYMKMLVEGRCVNCGKADDFTRQGRSRCKACNERYHHNGKKNMTQEQRDRENTYKREWAQMRKDAHVCIECGTKDRRTLDGRCQCLQCAKKRADRQREKWDYARKKEQRDARKAKWKAAGLCSNCGREREDETYAMCALCRLNYQLRSAKRKIAKGWQPRGYNGRCYQCNRAPAMEGKKLCPACYAKKVETLRKNSKYPWKETTSCQ